MGDLILGVIYYTCTLVYGFCCFELFLMVGKGLTTAVCDMWVHEADVQALSTCISGCCISVRTNTLSISFAIYALEIHGAKNVSGCVHGETKCKYV